MTRDVTTAIEIEIGQSWAIKDHSRRSGYRYVTVAETFDREGFAWVRTDRGRLGRVSFHRFHGPGFYYCGIREPGRDLPPFLARLSGDRAVLSLHAPLYTGFGWVMVTRDGSDVWAGDDPNKRLREFDEMARTDPDHDWRVEFSGPLAERLYQRQHEEWVLIWRGFGNPP